MVPELATVKNSGGDRASKPAISFRNILYATDFSRQAGIAAPFAQSLARHYGSRVFLTHVVSLAPFATYSPTQAWQALVSQAVREAEQSMDHVDAQWKDYPHETLVLKGDIWKEVSKIVARKNIDLIVVGTHGHGGVSKLIVGSVAEKIFRHAPCPVLTVGPNVSGEPGSVADIHSILCPTDFTPHSQGAMSAAVALAEEHRARLYLLHVTHEPVDQATEASLVDRLRDTIPAGAKLWCEPKYIVESGVAGEKIVEVAEELALDLIVMGAKRTPEIPGASFLPMSTAYRAVTQANCPVLTIHG